jgi:hypothetical protein
MLKSMTGFGRAEQTVNDKTFLVEIKSLNGKQFEMQLRLPPLLRPYEFDIRAILQEQLVRGTIDCMITIKQNGTSKPVNINTDLIKAYYHQIETLAGELSIDTNSVLSSLLRLTEVVTPTNDVLNDKDFEEFKKVLQTALSELNKHREEEGASLALVSESHGHADPKWSKEAGWQSVSEEHKARWLIAYPACDFGRQLAQMDLWLRANPTEARKSNWLRFITNWLKREQDRGGDSRADRKTSNGGKNANYQRSNDRSTEHTDEYAEQLQAAGL